MTQQLTASNRKDVRQAEKQAEIDERNRGVILQRIMSDGPGRKWLWDRLAECGIFDSTYYPDAHQLYYRQGERNIGLRLLADVLRFCPELYIQAQREANERHTLERQLHANAAESRNPTGDPSDTYAAELADDILSAARAADEYRHPAQDG